MIVAAFSVNFENFGKKWEHKDKLKISFPTAPETLNNFDHDKYNKIHENFNKKLYFSTLLKEDATIRGGTVAGRHFMPVRH